MATQAACIARSWSQQCHPRSPGVVYFTVQVFLRAFNFEQGCEGFPWAAIGGHGDVLIQGWKERDGGRVVIGLDPYVGGLAGSSVLRHRWAYRLPVAWFQP